MNVETPKPYDQLDDKAKAEHDKGAPVNQNHEDYEQNVDVAHEMAKAEKEDRDIIGRLQAHPDISAEFVQHRKARADAAAKKAGETERSRIDDENEKINEIIDLLQDAKRDGKKGLVLYVFDRDQAQMNAFRKYSAGNLDSEYTCNLLELSFKKRQELPQYLGFSPLEVTNQNGSEEKLKVYSAESNDGYFREVGVDVNVEDNPENPEAVVFDRYRLV